MKPPCHKRAYTGKADAKRAVKSGQQHGKKLRPYRCPNCGKWHLTSQPLRKPR